MSHKCPCCDRTIGDDLAMCATDWRKVPVPLKRAVYAAWADGRGAGTAEHREAVLAAVRHVNGEPEPAPQPTPHQLWEQAGGGTPSYDRRKYLDLMRQHGHLLKPGDAGYEEGLRAQAEGCGWPGPQRPDWDPDDG